MGYRFIAFIFLASGILSGNKILQDLSSGFKPYDKSLFAKEHTKDLNNNKNLQKDEQKDKIESKDSIRIMPLPINIPLDINTLSKTCSNKKFDIIKSGDINSREIINKIALECDFSVFYDNKYSFDEYTFLNFKQANLEAILSSLLAKSFYEIRKGVLYIKNKDTRIFDINYISTMRHATSSTDVVFSQDEDFQNYYQGYQRNSRFINQTNKMGKSGTKIYSVDELNFWEDISLELENILKVKSSFISRSSLQDKISPNLMDSNAFNTTPFSRANTLNPALNNYASKNLAPNNSILNNPINNNLALNKDSIKNNSSFSINKSAGLISVYANKAKMQEVATYLEQMQKKMHLQVSINVEIISLRHLSTSTTGVNWQNLFNIFSPSIGNSALSVSPSGISYSLNILNPNISLSSIFSFLQTYGDLQSLSNPKITALNNQPAIFSVGSVLRYSQNQVFQASSTANTIQNTNVIYPSVFAGILLDITPSISKNDIILKINPSITRTKDVALENMPVALSSPPNLSTNQLSSIVRLKDGQRVIIGGLINSSLNKTAADIKGLANLPGFKWMFSHKNNTKQVEELIIIITPHIIK